MMSKEMYARAIELIDEYDDISDFIGKTSEKTLKKAEEVLNIKIFGSIEIVNSTFTQNSGI